MHLFPRYTRFRQSSPTPTTVALHALRTRDDATFHEGVNPTWPIIDTRLSWRTRSIRGTTPRQHSRNPDNPHNSLLAGLAGSNPDNSAHTAGTLAQRPCCAVQRCHAQHILGGFP